MKTYPTLEKVLADAPKDPQQVVLENVKKLEAIRVSAALYPLADQLNDIVDVSDSTIQRAIDLADQIRRLDEALGLLIHDLRDDYGTGYKMVNPQG